MRICGPNIMSGCSMCVVVVVVVVVVIVISRPPGIYKPEYLQVLAERLNGASMAGVSIPERPAWCNEEEEAGSGSKHGRRRREVQNEVSRVCFLKVERMDGTKSSICYLCFFCCCCFYHCDMHIQILCWGHMIFFYRQMQKKKEKDSQ